MGNAGDKPITNTTRDRILAVIALIWLVAIPGIYYRQVWRIFDLGLIGWVKDNYSLGYSGRMLANMLLGGPSAWVPQFFDEALARAFCSITGAVIIFIAANMLGAVACALIRCKFDNWVEKTLFHSAIGLGALAYLSLLFASMDVYNPVWIRLLVFGTAGGGTIFYLNNLRQRPLSGLFDRANSWKAALFKSKLSSWQGVTILAGVMALIGALAPEIEYDALWYHLWLPKLWLENGSPVDLISEYISLYPLNWSLVYGAGLAISGPGAAKLLHFACLILGAMAIYQATRRWAPQTPVWAAIAMWITCPTLLWEATTAYVDLALAFFTVLIVYAALRYTERNEKSWLILAGLTAGIALGMKHLAVIIIMFVVIWMGQRLWLATKRIGPSIKPALVLMLIAFVMASPWYLRNWQASGNPVFPEFYNLFGASPPQRWDWITQRGLDGYKARFGCSRTFINLVMLPVDMTIHAARYGGNLGPIFLMLLPGLLFHRKRNWMITGSGLFVLFYTAVWASPISSFQMRFLMPVVPFLAILAAEGMRQINCLLLVWNNDLQKRAAKIGVVALLIMNLPPFLSLHEFDRAGRNGWLTHVIHTVPLGVVLGYESETSYLQRKVPSFAAWQYINAHLASDSRVLTFSGGDHFYGQRSRIPSDATIARGAVWVPQDEETWLNEVKSLGVTHILFDKKEIQNLVNEHLVIAQPAIIASLYTMEYEDQYFILYRLDTDTFP